MWGGMGVGWYGCGVVWVWGGMGVGWYGCGCGHGESNSCTKLYILRARLYHFIFVFCHSLCGLLNKLEGVGNFLGVVVRSCGCGEVGVRVGRWVLVWGVGRWVC